MSIRTIVYNFITEQAEIISLLESDKIIDVAEWFCYAPHGTADIRAFADVKYRLEDTYGVGEDVYGKVKAFLPVFLDMHQRRFPYFQNTLYDLVADFNRQFGVVYRLLMDLRPGLVLFGNIPHGGHDYLLYRTARALFIPTLVLYQVPVCPRFMILDDIDDFGAFSRRLQGSAEGIGPLPEIRRPFYMKRMAPSVRTIYRVLKPLANPRTALPYVGKAFRYVRHQGSLARAQSKLPRGARYAYFPLHLQPEMTTSALGGEYVDQMLAIERLARKMPPGTWVAVKENPKQSDYQRPASFYRRLRSITNAVLVPTKTDTFDLIRGCDFVATVTGTAGWEAINMGKPALVFGKAWYETLPGVHKYHSGIHISSICGASIARNELEAAYSKLMNMSWPGVVSSPYFQLIPGVNVHENNEKAAAALRSVLLGLPASV